MLLCFDHRKKNARNPVCSWLSKTKSPDKTKGSRGTPLTAIQLAKSRGWVSIQLIPQTLVTAGKRL